MSVDSIVLLDAAPLDLSGLALRFALDLVAAGRDVAFVDQRNGDTPSDPPDAIDLDAGAYARLGAPAAGKGGGFTLPPPANRWVVSASTAPAERTHTPWRPLNSAPAVDVHGTLDCSALRWPARLTLTALLGDEGARYRAPARPVPQAVRDQLLAALTSLDAPPALRLVEPAFFEAGGLELAQSLNDAGLRWTLVCGPAVDPDTLRELAALGCDGVELDLPTPSHPDFGQWTGAYAGAWPAALAVDGPPITLTWRVGLPGEGTSEQRAALAQLRPVISRAATIRVLPFAPHPGSSALAELDDWGARMIEGRGPHGWVAGHVNDAYRRKLVREYQLAIAALGGTVDAPLSLGRDVARHKDAIVARLTDPFHDAPPETLANLDLVGVLQGEKAFAGPATLELDLTNDCNNTCVGCWCHSLMMGDDRLMGAVKRKFLETELILQLLDDAAASGTKTLQVAGSGEPFMHPDVMKVLAHAKSLGLEVAVITNVNFITKDRAEKLIEVGVDRITASVWAGSESMYVKTHPNQTEKSFKRIREVLTYLWKRKRELRRQLPQVKMYHVISSINCRELIPMVEFAVETGCEQVELQITDVVPGKSDELALSDSDRAAVVEQLRELATRAVDPTRTAARDTSVFDALDAGSEVQQFGKFEKRIPEFEGWRWGDELMETIYCPRECEGSLPVRDFCDESETRYHYYWHVWDCHRCADFDTCPIEKVHLGITKEFTELVGFGSFYRRVVSQVSREGGGVQLEKAIVDRIPCTIGWTYSRVRVSGEVIPCCKGHLHPLGSLHESRFAEIWYGPTLDELRRMGKHEPKSNPYFSRIDCYRACDNVGTNLATAQRLDGLSAAAREHLGAASGLAPFVPAPKRSTETVVSSSIPDSE